MELHNPGQWHVERRERLTAARDVLQQHPAVRWHIAEPVDERILLQVHDAEYVDLVLSTRGRAVHFDADTTTSSESVDAALLAAGAAVAAARSAVEQTTPAIALVRPPGHHATVSRAMGFCLFNNIAAAAANAIDTLDVERVLIIDWDVHHGNGTQDIFWRRDDVFFFSSHQGPGFYPGTGSASETGAEAGRGFTLNTPLSAGASDRELIKVFDEGLRPAADRFRPQLVLVSAGFDAHADDPLGGLQISDEGFAALCSRAQDISRDHCDGRIALILEGGYDLAALGRSVKVCVDTLAQDE